jgi:hypothetical protein
MEGKKKVYLAGPMTGYEFYNLAGFTAAATHWREAGYDVTTPFECNSVVWRRHYGEDFDPTKHTCDYGDPILGEMLLEDITALCSADVVAVLPGWEKSKGAKLEVLLAQSLGKEILAAETRGRIAASVLTAVEASGETILQEAQRLVHGDRGAAYGHPIEDYTRTGRMWGAILGLPDIDPRICALMMAAMKLSREAHKPKRDNRTDLAGYAECADMIAQRQALGAPSGV